MTRKNQSPGLVLQVWKEDYHTCAKRSRIPLKPAASHTINKEVTRWQDAIDHLGDWEYPASQSQI